MYSVISEQDVIDPVVEWAKDNGIVCIKFTPRGDVGWPDHVFILPLHGTHIWIEFKRPGKKPTPLQAHRIETINKQGGFAYWSCISTHAIYILETILNDERRNDEEAAD